MLPPLSRLLVLTGIVLLILGILVYLYVLLRKARKNLAASPESAGQAAASSNGNSDKDASSFTTFQPVLSYSQLKSSFSQASRYLRGRANASGYRYQFPLYLVVGERQSGKSSLLSGLIPDLSTDNASHRISHPRSGVEWFFYDEAAVLEVEGDATPPPNGHDPEERVWRDVLRLLQSHRPDRPIDGVILTVTCEDLVAGGRRGSAGEAAMCEKSLAWYKRLTLAQKMLEMSFPVYVVVTKCDQLAGFGDFCRALPSQLHDRTHPPDEMLGWSNPYPLDSSFDPRWVDEAFRTLQDQLHMLQLELFAAQEEVGNNDGVFLFPLKIQLLRKPLGDYLAQVFRQTALRQRFAFRGLYFCGDQNAKPLFTSFLDEGRESALVVRDAGRLTGAAGNLPTGEAAPVFVRHLFESKIFVERGLSQPVPGVSLSKNRTIAAVQIALLVLLMVFAPGLYLAHRSLAAEQTKLNALLRHVKCGLGNVLIARLNEGQGSLGSGIDLSWRSDCDPGKTLELRGPGVTNLLASQADQSWQQDEQHEKDAQQLRKDSQQVREDLTTLNDDQFGRDDHFGSFFIPSSWVSPINRNLMESLTPAFNHIVLGALRHDLDEETENVLSSAEEPKLRMHEFVEDLGALIENRDRYRRLARKGEAPLDDLRILFEYLGHPYMSKNLDGKGKARLYLDALANATGAQLATGGIDMDQLGARRIAYKIDGTYQEIVSKGFFKTEADLSELVGHLDDIAQTEHLLTLPNFKAMAGLTFPESSPLKRLTLISGLYELRSTLEALAGEKFMKIANERASGLRASGGARVMWDRAPLLEAISQFESYEIFIAQKLDPHSERLKDDVQKRSLSKVQEDIERLLRQARLGGAAFQQGFGNDLMGEVKSFKDAEDLLSKLAEVSAKLEMKAKYDALVTNEVYALLQKVSRQFIDENHYHIRKDGFAWWDGNGQVGQRLSLTVYGVKSQEELAAYLANHRGQIAFAAREYAAPLINFLAARNYNTQLLRNAQLVNWAEIASQLDKHEKMSPSTVAQLENFILEEMDKVTPAQCPKPAPASAWTSDFFLRARNQLRQQLYDRCYYLADKDVFRRYGELRDNFNSRLAGRFPFARPGSARDFAEADPEAVAEFYRLLDKSGKSLKDALAQFTETESSAARALEFIEQMEETREFLMPILAPMLARSGPPVADLEIKFRVNQGRELCAYQIIDWELEVGRERIGYRDPARALRWRYGDQIKLSLRWAKDSPSAPKLEGQRPHVKVIDRTASFEFANRWSLLALFARHLAPLADYDPVAAPDPHLLGFEVWTHDGGNQIRKDVCAQEVGGLRLPLVKTFVSLKVMPPGKKEGLAFPGFPQRAPQLEREMVVGNRSTQ